MDAQELTELLENRGMEVYKYSGRGMVGRQCPAVTISRDTNILGVVANIMADFAQEYDTGEDTKIYDLADVFASAKTDSMGLDIVLYFSQLHYDKK